MDGLFEVIQSLFLLLVLIGFAALVAKITFKVGIMAFKVSMMIFRFYIGILTAPFRMTKWIFMPIWKAVAFEDVREATKNLPHLR